MVVESLKTMKTVAIFGCGGAGKYAASRLSRRYVITAFLDNNRSLWGAEMEGIRIENPSCFDYDSVTRIYIASMYEDEIFCQLLRLGVSVEKILEFDYVPDHAMMNTARKPDPIGELACWIGKIIRGK